MLGAMKREDIEHLASLARIRLTEEEKEQLPEQLSSIVSYVSVVSEIAGEEADATPQVGVIHNVFRQDAVTNEPDQFTKDILAEMPKTSGRHLSVKKILTTDE
tara:strand:- start:5194 stop:5502 length:309 start_codon:yes stop_codon:yes gene_type:complete